MEHLRHWVLVMWLVHGQPNKHWESLWYLLGIVLRMGEHSLHDTQCLLHRGHASTLCHLSL